MPFACIYVPNFPVAAALRAEPELQPRALVILEGKPPLEKIFAVNDQAAGMGIAPGMTKAQAELCADIALRPRSALHESSAHAALLDCAQSFSPCVEDTACDTALLDLAGMESLLGSLSEISCSIHTRATALGLAANVAVASNPDAAMLAARGLCGAGSCGAGALARATITVIPAGKEAEHMGSLPTKVLFPDRLEKDQLQEDEKKAAVRLLETLDRWGIRNLSGLAALPQVSLSERLGQEGLRLQQLACGNTRRTLVPIEEPMRFEEAVELDHPIVLLEPLAFLLNRLLEQICARLAARALSTQELRLTLELENFSARHQPSTNHQQFARTLRLPLPMLDAKVFLKLLQLDLNAHPPGAPIMKIHLAVEPARPRSAQEGLFLPPSPEPEKLELTLARIAGMVGENKVGALELLDTHHPHGFRMQRFVAEPPRKNKPEKSPDAAAKQSPEQSPQQSSQPSPVTALRRFRPPLRATMTLENGQPARMACGKKKEVQGDVLWRAGPWRSSGDWWEREAWSRDEWDIALQNNALRNGDAVSFYRVVHDLLGGGWFVEGTYD
jgi:protein ImuB